MHQVLLTTRSTCDKRTTPKTACIIMTFALCSTEEISCPIRLRKVICNNTTRMQRRLNMKHSLLCDRVILTGVEIQIISILDVVHRSTLEFRLSMPINSTVRVVTLLPKELMLDHRFLGRLITSILALMVT